MNDNHFIGEQVAYWRKRRGKSQRVLAGLAGISQPYLSQIENGNRAIERRSTLVALADALQVSAAELTGQPGDPTDPAKARAAAHIPAIREALIMREISETQSGNGDAEAALAGAVAYDFAAVAPLLPGLITSATGVDLIKTCHATMSTCRHLGYLDLARDATRLGLATARELADPAWIGVAEYLRVHSLPHELTGVVDLASRAADQIQPHIGDPNARQAYGMLHLSAALRSAIEKQRDAAMDHLREAGSVAESLGDPSDGLGLGRLAFGPTNVAIWRLTVQCELGEVGKAVADAATIRPERLLVANRPAWFYLDLARAYAHSGRNDDKAVAAFLRAESITPQFVRLQPVMRDTIAVIVRRTRRRAVSAPLRHAAAMVGLRLDAGIS